MIAKIYLFSDTFNAKSEFEIAVDEHGNVLYERAISFDVILNPHRSFTHIDDWKGSWGLKDELEVKPYVTKVPTTIDGSKSLHILRSLEDRGLIYFHREGFSRIDRMNIPCNRILATVKDCGCPLDSHCTCSRVMKREPELSYQDAYREWVSGRVNIGAVQQEGPKPCTCDIMALMQAGCRCGHLKKDEG